MKSMHLFKTDKNSALFQIDTFPYFSDHFYLNLTDYNFYKHSLILGASGSGKSKFISLLVEQIIKSSQLKNQYRVVIVDPHASLEEDIGGLGKVVNFKNSYIDLFHQEVDDPQVSTELLLELFISLNPNQYNSKLERVLRYSLYLLLANHSFNFSNLKKVVLDLDYRNNIIREQRENLPFAVINFFLSDFNDLKTKAYGEAISPIISFIDEMEMIPVFNSEQNYDNLKKTIHDNFLTLFSLDRTKLGDKVTKTIAGLIMGQLLTLVQRREIDEHIIFIIDEVSVVENQLLSRYLSEARKYNLSLILVGQYFNQISDKLKSSIFANVVNYFIFRVSKLDATTLVDNFNMKIPLDDSKERKISLMTELNNRECIVRIDTNGVLLPAFKARTLDYTSIPRIKSNEEKVNANKLDKPRTLKNDFKLDSNVNLKDILISNSTNKKGVGNNG